MKSLKALCTGVMTFCVASFCFTSCYDDSALNARLDEVEDELSSLDERVKAIEALKGQLTDLTARVDALYTLEFQVSDSNELQYSFDGGTTWVSTGVVLAEECTCEVPEPCTCKEVSLVDNGDSVTITVGDQSFTIEKPEEIVFDIRAGKVYFASEGTQKIAIKTSGVTDLTVMAAPKGWYAEIASDGMLEVTAPDFQATVEDGYWNDDWTEYIEVPATAAAEGYVKVHACGVDGKCMVGKVPVVVSAQPVSVKAYNDTAYFNAAGDWPALFYYGASPKESFETEVASLIEQMNARGYADWNANGDGYDNYPTVEASIEELLGAKIEEGKEYVVYALVEDYTKTSYSIEDFIVNYYSRVNVTAVENEAERTAYNVTATVEVTGANSYYAVAIPGNYVETAEDLLMYKENMVGSLDPDNWSGPMGKLYTDSYTGSVLDIAEGTQSSMSGNYAPAREIYLLVLPLDGRAWFDYAPTDVWQFDFKTADLTAGGSVDATAELVDKYTAEEFDRTTYETVTVEKEVDPYSQLAVKVNPSSDAWYSFYYQWLDDETWAMYGSDDELLVDYLLKGYGNTPDETEFPYYAVESTTPETTLHFVAMFVDESGKYGKLAKVDGTTKAVSWSDIAWDEANLKTNLVNGVLKNTNTFEITPATDVKASKYKYVWIETGYYNTFDGMDDAAMATAIHLNQTSSYTPVTVSAEELVDGKITVAGHYYGSSYYLAVLPYDEAGNPGKSAQIFDYSCAFVIDDLVTDSASFVAEPTIVVNVPTENDIYAGDAYGDGVVCSYTYHESMGSYTYYYEVNCTITPVEGTEVAAVFVDANNYSAFANGDAKTRAAGVWQKSYGSWHTYITTEPYESSNRGFNQYSGNSVPDVYLAVSWKDADGNYYYKEYALGSEFRKLYDLMHEKIYGYVPVDWKQFTFVWTDMGDAPSCIDLGVTTPGQLAVCYDAAAVYGEDALPAEMVGKYMQYMAWEYEVEATDATSGVITLKSYDMYGDLQTTEATYTDWNGTTCVVNCDMLYLTDVTMTVATETIPLYIESAAGGAL